jgi:hypothetical protein
MEADHDRQLQRIGPERTGEAGAFLLSVGIAARRRQSAF